MGRINIRKYYHILVPRKIRSAIYFYAKKTLGEVNFIRLHKILKIGMFNEKVTKTNVMFIHIPKCGGTSIAKSLFNIKGLGHFRASNIRSVDRKLYEESYKISIIRDPYERLVSAHEFYTKNKSYDVKLSDRNTGPIPTDFEEFVLNWLVNQDVDELDYVFHTQHSYITYNDKSIIDEIFTLNNISEIENRVSELIGVDYKMKHLNKACKKIDYLDKYSNSLVKDTVYKIYRKDVEMYHEYSN